MAEVRQRERSGQKRRGEREREGWRKGEDRRGKRERGKERARERERETRWIWRVVNMKDGFKHKTQVSSSTQVDWVDHGIII